MFFSQDRRTCPAMALRSASTIRLAIYRETGNRHGEGVALDNLGNALEEVRRFEEAITAHQEGLAIYRETGTARPRR